MLMLPILRSGFLKPMPTAHRIRFRDMARLPGCMLHAYTAIESTAFGIRTPALYVRNYVAVSNCRSEGLNIPTPAGTPNGECVVCREESRMRRTSSCDAETRLDRPPARRGHLELLSSVVDSDPSAGRSRSEGDDDTPGQTCDAGGADGRSIDTRRSLDETAPSVAAADDALEVRRRRKSDRLRGGTGDRLGRASREPLRKLTDDAERERERGAAAASIEPWWIETRTKIIN